MKQTLSYNIHNILKFQINRDKGYGFRDLINLKFSPFQVATVDKPDIILNIGRFTPSNDHCYVIDYKYYIKENYLYCKDSAGKIDWEIEIIGLEQRNTTINFAINGGFQLQLVNSLYASLFLPQVFLLRVIEHKLNKMGYFVAHAAAVAKDGQAYLFTGRNGCFKTSLCLEFARRAGFGWLGDDRIILDKGKALGLPINPSLFEFMKRHLPDETYWRFPRQVQFMAEYLRGRLRQGAGIKPGADKLKAILLIERNNRLSSGKVSFSRLLNSQMGQVVDSFITNSELEDFTNLSGFGIKSAPFRHYMLAYSFVFPGSSITHREELSLKNLTSALANITVYRVGIPPEYNTDTFSQICQFLTELGGGDA